MLHFETVEPNVVPLLKRLFGIEALRGCSLVGGTALSLRYGHRKSVDLDLFCSGDLDRDVVVASLEQEFGDMFEYKPGRASWAIFCHVDGVKVDIVRYPHPRIAPELVVEGLRLYDDADIAAMKIQAILGRGVKKDFWDLYELFKHHDLKWVLDRHAEKYPNQMIAVSIPHALTYFVDAEESETPMSLKGQTWEAIQRSISQTVSDYLK
ncbi:MAG: nucleotidyl transferase AbiEii/AbiGii toxin family protein [Flavobacteriales bacterium]